MDRPDPFFVVKDEVIKSLAQAKGEYETWRQEVLKNSSNIKPFESALKQTIRNIDWDLEDLQETVLIVEKNPAKFFISADELRSREYFLQSVKNVIRSVKNQLADPHDPDLIDNAINFDVSLLPINGHHRTKPDRPNGLSVSLKLGEPRQFGLSDRLKFSGDNSRGQNGLLTEQKQLLQDQDTHLDQLGNSISRLKDMSHRIGGELEDQVALLDEFGEEMAQTDSRLDSAMKRAARLLHLDNSKSQWWAIGSLLLLLILVIVLFGIL